MMFQAPNGQALWVPFCSLSVIAASVMQLLYWHEGAELKDQSQAQDPLVENFDEVEEVSAHLVENMEVDPSEEGLERKSEEASSNATPVSPDSNKENLGSSSEGGSVSQEKTEEDKDRSPIMTLGGLRKPKNPFTELRRSTSSSRAAMLVSLATGRRPSLDAVSSPSPPLLSPKVPNDNQRRPWVKYAPSPSSASPTASCLKRSADELDSSLEGSPVSSAKRPRISLGPRKVHFPENPVSDSVEIPRAPEGKHTRKKLQLLTCVLSFWSPRDLNAVGDWILREVNFAGSKRYPRPLCRGHRRSL